MALHPIKGTIINLDDVFLSTEDGVRYVTDRFSLWRLDELSGRSKLAQALHPLQDGCYKLTAAGAATVNPVFTQVPNCARLVPEAHDGPILEATAFVVDYKKDGLRLWRTEAGLLVGLDARWITAGYTLRVHTSGEARKPVSVLNSRGDFAGILMPVRVGDEVLAGIRQLAESITPAERVA